MARPAIQDLQTRPDLLHRERPEERPHFLVHRRFIRKRLRNLVAQQYPVALPQPVNRHPHRALLHA